MDQFDGSAFKLRRARDHINSLGRALEEFAASKPYTFYIEPHPKPPDFVLRVRESRTVPVECGLIVGDFAHNARSALDLLVFELSTLAAGDKDRRGLQFPIFDDKVNYSKNRDRYLRGVGKQEREIIEQFQPYQSSGDGSVDILSVLARINNTDKHRVIPVVAVLGHLDSLADTRGIEFSPDAQILLNRSRNDEVEYTGVGDGVLTDGAILGKLKLGPAACLELQPNSSIVIQFGGKDAEVAGRDLMPSLCSIFDRTKEIVQRFRA